MRAVRWAPFLIAASTLAWCKPIQIPGLTSIPTPPGINVSFNGKKVKSFRCHKSLRVPLQAALKCVVRRGHASALHTYAGCYCYRNIRGTNRLSNHAHGKALDLNVGLPMHSGIVTCFKEAGFRWGGDWKTPDIMHFELKGRG